MYGYFVESSFHLLRCIVLLNLTYLQSHLLCGLKTAVTDSTSWWPTQRWHWRWWDGRRNQANDNFDKKITWSSSFKLVRQAQQERSTLYDKLIEFTNSSIIHLRIQPVVRWFPLGFSVISMSDRFVSWALDDQNQIGMKALHFLDWFRTVHSRIMQITAGGYAWTGCKVLCKSQCCINSSLGWYLEVLDCRKWKRTLRLWTGPKYLQVGIFTFFWQLSSYFLVITTE